jgi:hypothetical protein
MWDNWIAEQFLCKIVFVWVGRCHDHAPNGLVGVDDLDATPIGQLFNRQAGDIRQGGRIIQ